MIKLCTLKIFIKLILINKNKKKIVKINKKNNNHTL